MDVVVVVKEKYKRMKEKWRGSMCELESMCRLYEDIAAGSIVTSSCFPPAKPLLP